LLNPAEVISTNSAFSQKVFTYTFEPQYPIRRAKTLPIIYDELHLLLSRDNGTLPSIPSGTSLSDAVPS